LERLADWLAGHGVTHAAMEATGVYWKPVWAVLADELDLVLANAAQVKNVPGRKTDVNDAMWLADLLAHGLIRGSFVPPPAVQALRDLTRTRKQLIREKAGHVQRIDKLLQAANIKLGSVLSDIMGESGRAILDALATGESDPEALAGRVRTRVRASRAELVAALRGRMSAHQRLLLRLHLAQADALDAAVAAIDQEVGDRLEPFHQAVALLSTIPGVGEVAAGVIVAEIGVDMTRFPSAGHLVSWAGLCPKNDESAGKRRSTRQGRALAQDPAGPGGLGRNPSQAQLPARPLPSRRRAPRSAQGDHRRRRRHPHRDLLDAQAWTALPRPRPRSLRQDQPSAPRSAPGQEARRTRLRRRHHRKGAGMMVSS
jgi:transposase